MCTLGNNCLKDMSLVPKNVDNANVSIKILEKHSFLLNYFGLVFPRFCNNIVQNGEDQIYVTGNSFCVEHFLDFFKILKYHTLLQFNILLDIVCIDFLEVHRFRLVYHLLSTRYDVRLNVCFETGVKHFFESISSIYSSAEWLEREIWDMFGVFFMHHMDLRRILTDYGFDSFPLRKDFPMVGFVEIFYDEVQKRILFEGVELVQGYRTFDIKTSWESESI